MTNEPAPDILSEFWSPLCAIGARGPSGPNAQISVSVFGASIVPERPRVLISLSKSNYTHDLVAAEGTFAVTVLAGEQLPLLDRLGLRSGRDGDKLAGLEVVLTAAGDPYFPSGAGYLACEVLEAFDVGDATAFLSAVRARETFSGARPMRWAEARTRVGEDFLTRWMEKTQREQEAARRVMTWR